MNRNVSDVSPPKSVVKTSAGARGTAPTNRLSTAISARASANPIIVFLLRVIVFLSLCHVFK
jgi:hypothetical protein